MPNYDRVKDSGQRQAFETGSVRDMQAGKGSFFLLPAEPMFRLAKHYENGAIKYGNNNWKLGQPSTRYMDSALRHLFSYLMGKRDEDHLAAVVFNVFGIMWNEECKPEMHDLEEEQPATTEAKPSFLKMLLTKLGLRK